MKKLIAACALTAALLPLSGVHADLLLNGDLSLGTGSAESWIQWTGGGWNNWEVSPNGITPDNPHLALGNAGPSDNGAHQTVAATAGLIYELQFDAGSPEGWWNPLVKANRVSGCGRCCSRRTGRLVDPYVDFDVPLAWKTYSVSGTAPALTTPARVIVMNQNPVDGGTMRFDNISLTVIPEPSSLALLGLGALMIGVYRRK